MVRALGWLPVLLLGVALAAPRPAEDRSTRVASRLASDGLAGRLAEALKTDPGRRALQERIELLQAVPLARIRQDAHGLFEEHYFAADEIGRLVLRPERGEAFDRIKARRAAGVARFEQFSRRLDAVGDQVLAESELDQAAKAGWKEREWRLGLYNAYVSGGIHESDHDLDQLLETRLLLWVPAGDDAKLRVGDAGEGPLAQLMGEVYQLMEEAKKYEAAVAKVLGKVDEAVVLLTSAKLATEARTEGVDVLTRLVGLDPKEAVKDAEAAVSAGARLKTRLDQVAAGLADDDTRSLGFKTFLGDARARVFLAVKLTPIEAPTQARIDRFFASVLPASWCEPKGDKFVFKRSLFRDWRGGDSVDGFRSHTYGAWMNQLVIMHQLLRSTAERCADGAVAAVLKDLEMLALLRQEIHRISEAKGVAVQDRGVDLFLTLHFVEKEGKLAVRPGREASIESLLSRVEELRPKN